MVATIKSESTIKWKKRKEDPATNKKEDATV